MIKIKFYRNGYEVIGHSDPYTCSEVSFWDWIASGMIIGLDKNARRYTSSNDNPDNPMEGLSWAICNPEMNNLAWILEDFAVSAENWGKERWKSRVEFEWLDCDLVK